jgi:hypothetical protein
MNLKKFQGLNTWDKILTMLAALIGQRNCIEYLAMQPANIYFV